MKKILFALAALLLLGGGEEKPRKSLPASSTKPTAKPTTAPQSEPTPKEPQTSTKGRSILLIGDSLSAGASTAGGRLAKLLRDAGHDVDVNAMGSRRAGSWLKGTTVIRKKDGTLIQENGKASEQLKGKTYDVAIVFLGTNDAAGDAIARDKGNKETEILSHEPLAELLSKHATKVIAISPPAFSDGIEVKGKWGTYDDTINDVAKDYLRRYGDIYGNVVDAISLSKDITEGESRRDLIHFSGKGAQTFAERLANAIKPYLVNI